MRRFSLLAAVLICLTLSAFAGKNPADFPWKVYILQQAWGSHNLRYRVAWPMAQQPRLFPASPWHPPRKARK